MRKSTSPFKKARLLGKNVDPSSIHIGSFAGLVPGDGLRDSESVNAGRHASEPNRPVEGDHTEDHNIAFPTTDRIEVNDFAEQFGLNSVPGILATGTGAKFFRFSSQRAENLESGLNALLLKKLIASLTRENEELRKDIEVKKAREPGYGQKVQALSARLQEFVLREMLDVEKPSEHLQDDFDEIDRHLALIDSSLDQAMGDKGQEFFLQKVIETEKEYFVKVEQHSRVLHNLTDGVQRFKNTLVNVNLAKY